MRGHFVLDNVDLGTWKESENDKALNENPDTLMVDPCLGHCNFDGGFCGWSNDQEDDFDWNLVTQNQINYFQKLYITSTVLCTNREEEV